jgi:hypothetical protein
MARGSSRNSTRKWREWKREASAGRIQAPAPKRSPPPAFLAREGYRPSGEVRLWHEQRKPTTETV